MGSDMSPTPVLRMGPGMSPGLVLRMGSDMSPTPILRMGPGMSPGLVLRMCPYFKV